MSAPSPISRWPIQEISIGSLHNILAVLIAVVIFTLINTVSLALIVSPVMGMSPFDMWRANVSGVHVELISVATLGSLIPVLVAEQPLSVVLLVVPLMLGPHLAFKGIRQAHQEARVTMEGLADALERRDPYTSRHSIRVTEYVGAVVSIMPQISRTTAEAIVAAARVHDLGKVGSRDGSLKKPGDLTDQERQEIQQHAAVGAEMVGRLEAYRQSVATIRHHHERWDGSGYPDGLKGEQIPLGSRIIGVADAYDAMTSDRVYRPALAVEIALAELRKGQGTQFDPQIVDLFIKAHAEGLLVPGHVTQPVSGPMTVSVTWSKRSGGSSRLKTWRSPMDATSAQTGPSPREIEYHTLARSARSRDPTRPDVMARAMASVRPGMARRARAAPTPTTLSSTGPARAPTAPPALSPISSREKKRPNSLGNRALKIRESNNLIRVGGEPGDRQGHNGHRNRACHAIGGQGDGTKRHRPCCREQGPGMLRRGAGDDAAGQRAGRNRGVEQAHAPICQTEHFGPGNEQRSRRLHERRQAQADEHEEQEIAPEEPAVSLDLLRRGPRRSSPRGRVSIATGPP